MPRKCQRKGCWCNKADGCHSQGKTKAEAIENIREAIREWFAAAKAEKSILSITEEEVTV
jgi:predicted RNase H-like HicB family nuclease